MHRKTGFDFQHVMVTDRETLDSHSNVVARLQLERLPGGRKTCEELFKKVGLNLAYHQDSRERVQPCHHFVFQGQCLVLGDSGVGKTSLVRSITGKPFNEMEPRTQGIEQSIVDQKWQSLDTKDLIFGTINRFFKEIRIQLMIYRENGDIIYDQSMRRTIVLSPFFVLFCTVIVFATVSLFLKDAAPTLFIYEVPLMLFFFVLCNTTLSYVFSPSNNHRLKISFGEFVINPYGLLIGAFLSVFLDSVVGMFYGKLSQIEILSYIFLFLATAIVLIYFYVSLFFRGQKPLKNIRIWRRNLIPRQINFWSQKPIAVIFFLRLLLNIVLSFIFVTAFSVFFVKSVDQATSFVRNGYIIVCLVKSVPRMFKSPLGWQLKLKFVFGVICYLCIQGFLLPSNLSFVLTYLILLCDTLHIEYLYLTSVISTSGHDHKAQDMFTAVFLENAVIDLMALKRALVEKWSSVKLKILDFAGDKEYHSYHHMFLRSQAIYVIVFNMAKFAENFNSLMGINSNIKSLHVWLESIGGHVAPNTPIILVGTHRGNMAKTSIERVNDHLKKNFWDLFCDELIVNKVDDLIFFPVENSVGQNDLGIHNFQRAIMAVVEELRGTIGQHIPLSWIQMQDALIQMRNDKIARVCVMYEDFPTVFDDFICTNWTEETLKYFHDKGYVMYLNKEPKWVLLNPGVLVDIIIQLVMQPEERIPQRGFRSHWKLLQDEGMLTQSLLESILSKVVQENREPVTAFLEEYNLICPLMYQKTPVNGERLTPTHFVPALLPDFTDENTHLWSDRSTDKKFYVFFKKFLPEPFFHHLLSRAHKNSKVDFSHCQPLVFRDAGKFWLNPRQPYMLKLLKDMKMIEVTFTRSCKGMRPSDVLCQVFAMVDGICERSFPFVKFHCGPACPSPECPGHQEEGDFLAHAVGEPSVKRYHVYDIMPARKGDKTPFMYCVNQCFKDELIEWMP